jgi:hypothetical protein
MQVLAGSDRRKYRRIGTDQMVSFASVSGRQRVASGRDISKGGIRFEVMGCEINLGDMLTVTFNLESRRVVAVGRVAWATDVDALSTDVGIEFVELDPAASRVLEELEDEAES